MTNISHRINTRSFNLSDIFNWEDGFLSYNAEVIFALCDLFIKVGYLKNCVVSEIEEGF